MYKLAVLFCSFCFSHLAYGQSITDAEIDRYLGSLPQTKDLVSAIESEIEESSKENSRKMSFASMEGRTLRTIIELNQNEDKKSTLAALVKDAGFESVDDWALTGDRIMGVLTSVQWVTVAASIPNPGGEEPDVKPDTNIFEYIADESKPAKDRKKYQTQLGEMCERLCYEQADFDVVTARYVQITERLEALK